MGFRVNRIWGHLDLGSVGLRAAGLRGAGGWGALWGCGSVGPCGAPWCSVGLWAVGLCGALWGWGLYGALWGGVGL